MHYSNMFCMGKKDMINVLPLFGMFHYEDNSPVMKLLAQLKTGKNQVMNQVMNN